MQYFRYVNDTIEEITLYQLKKENPKVSFPKEISDDLLASYGITPFVVQELPVYNVDTEKAIPGEYVSTATGYVRNWVVVPLTTEEAAVVAAEKVKEEKLAKADPLLVVDAIDQLVKDLDALTKRVEALEAKDKP